MVLIHMSEKKDDVTGKIIPVVASAGELLITGSLLGSALKTMSKLLDDIDEPKEKKEDVKPKDD